MRNLPGPYPCGYDPGRHLSQEHRRRHRDMNETIVNLFFLFSRYVHIVATTLIVGGTLFFEMVVPLAIGDLKTEVQLALFGRMRWIFRWVVYSSAIALVVTGSVSMYRNYHVLDGRFIRVLSQSAGAEKIQ